jgi:hypothetical protein
LQPTRFLPPGFSIKFYVLVVALSAILAVYLSRDPAAVARVAGQLLVYESLAWLVAAFLTFWVMWTFSVMTIGELWKPSLTTSAPVLWFVPAIFLLAAPLTFAAVFGVALVLVVVATLFFRIMPIWASGTSSRTRERRPLMFDYAVTPPPLFARNRLALIAGALAVQMAMCLTLAGFPVAAEILAIAGFIHWIAAWVIERNRRGSIRDHGWSPVMSLPVALLLALLLPTISSTPTKAHPLPLASKDGGTETRTQVTHLAGNFAEGIRFISKRNPLVHPPARVSSGRLSVASAILPNEIPFTGEYRLFPASSVAQILHWVLEPGAPFDSLYQTVGGGTLVTEASQPLDPPLDLSGLASIRIEVVCRDSYPIGVRLALVQNNREHQLGPEVLGFGPGRSETLEFALPAFTRFRNVDGFHVRFESAFGPSDKSIRVSVQRFTFVPAKS